MGWPYCICNSYSTETLSCGKYVKFPCRNLCLNIASLPFWKHISFLEMGLICCFSANIVVCLLCLLVNVKSIEELFFLWHKSWVNVIHLLGCNFTFCFLVLGLEFSASHLLDRHTTILATLPVLLVFRFFLGRVSHFFLVLACLDYDPPIYVSP
jgi:hypothetical protein